MVWSDPVAGATAQQSVESELETYDCGPVSGAFARSERHFSLGGRDYSIRYIPWKKVLPGARIPQLTGDSLATSVTDVTLWFMSNLEPGLNTDLINSGTHVTILRT